MTAGDHGPGQGGKARIVRISHQTAVTLDRYIRVLARHAQAYRPQLGVNNRGPVTANGIYQMIVRRGRQSGVAVHPHRFRHHFSHAWLDRGGAEGDSMELNGWTSPQMLRRDGASPAAHEPAAATTASWTPPPDTRAPRPNSCSEVSEAAWHVVLREPSCVHLPPHEPRADVGSRRRTESSPWLGAAVKAAQTSC